MSAGFILLVDMHQKREEFFLQKRIKDISKMFLNQYSAYGLTQKLIDDLDAFNFSIVLEEEQIKKLIADEKTKIRPIKHAKHAKIFSIINDNDAYIYIESKKVKALLYDKTPLFMDKSISFFIYLAIVIIFLFLYISIINKLKPLKKLNKVVANFGDEKFDFEFVTNSEDEISKLINEFSASAKKLKNIKESRNIFIRNIMHELKTPIAKGKFLIHLPQTEENLDTMQKVFYRLEALINEFAAIEELISTKKELEKKEYYLEDIIDNAVDILMCDEVSKEFENIKLRVDFALFSIALKNLLDNGIKYSKDKKVTIKTKNKNIMIENFAEPLLYPLENYFEPFFRVDDKKSNQSFGLGLYIIKHILSAHEMQLHYEHSEGINRFIIVV